MRSRFRFGSLPSGYNYVPAWIAGVVFVVGIGLTALASDPLFHDLAAFFNIALYCSLFILTWHSRQLDHDPFFVFLGICSFSISCMEALYVLAFRGAFAFLGRGPELSAGLWTMTRMMEAIALAVAPLFVHRSFRALPLLAASCGVLCVVAAGTVLWPVFPDPRVIVNGPMSLAAICAGATCILCVASLLLTVARRGSFEPVVLRYVVACVGLKVIVQLFVILSLRGAAWAETAAQLATMVSIFLLYRAVAHDAHADPSRVVVWEGANDGRRARRTVVEIQETPRLVPICMTCNRIRMADGTWRSIEGFEAEKEGVVLSHGICPECAERVYSEAVRGSC